MINACKIIKSLPSGGQKDVQLAEHPDFGKVVIKKGSIKSFISLERIKREVDLLSQLDSEFYPRQYHFNIDIKTKEFEIVEDYIEGQTLREATSLFRSTEKIFSLLHSLLQGLSIIWDKKIVHRDLKPENIIIRDNGLPCIIDLGIARFLDLEDLTRTIAVMGPCTPIYASPEQLSNRKNIIDPRTDFYCLGIISLELFLGIHPFDPTLLKNEFSIVENILQNNYLTNGNQVEEDQRMTQLASKTLRKEPFERFRTRQMFQDFVDKHR